MVAVVDPLGVAARPITLAAREEASGLASMIGQYVEQILEDSPEKRAEVAGLRGRLGLHAREGDVAVTIAFTDGGVVIEEGLNEPDAVIFGEVEFLMHVLAGRRNPVWELGGRRVVIRPSPRRPLFAYRAYHLMRLPGVHAWSGLPHPPPRLVAGAAVIVGVGVLVWRVRRSRARS